MGNMKSNKFWEAACNGLTELGKKATEHISKHSTEYIAGTAAVGVGYVAYKAGENKGRLEGKKEGTVEQSERDERKFVELLNRHEEDRRQWKKIDKKKDKLINDIINKS